MLDTLSHWPTLTRILFYLACTRICATVARTRTVVHPARRNLTVIRAYSRLGGHPDDPQSDPQDRSWFGPHDRLFRQEESEPIDFKLPPPYVWCWGWDGAGDIEGPDVEPVWEALKNSTKDPRTVWHDRGFSS